MEDSQCLISYLRGRNIFIRNFRGRNKLKNLKINASFRKNISLKLLLPYNHTYVLFYKDTHCIYFKNPLIDLGVTVVEFNDALYTVSYKKWNGFYCFIFNLL